MPMYTLFQFIIQILFWMAVCAGTMWLLCEWVNNIVQKRKRFDSKIEVLDRHVSERRESTKPPNPDKVRQIALERERRIGGRSFTDFGNDHTGAPETGVWFGSVGSEPGTCSSPSAGDSGASSSCSDGGSSSGD